MRRGWSWVTCVDNVVCLCCRFMSDYGAWLELSDLCWQWSVFVMQVHEWLRGVAGAQWPVLTMKCVCDAGSWVSTRRRWSWVTCVDNVVCLCCRFMSDYEVWLELSDLCWQCCVFVLQVYEWLRGVAGAEWPVLTMLCVCAAGSWVTTRCGWSWVTCVDNVVCLCCRFMSDYEVWLELSDLCWQCCVFVLQVYEWLRGVAGAEWPVLTMLCVCAADLWVTTRRGWSWVTCFDNVVCLCCRFMSDYEAWLELSDLCWQCCVSRCCRFMSDYEAWLELSDLCWQCYVFVL